MSWFLTDLKYNYSNCNQASLPVLKDPENQKDMNVNCADINFVMPVNKTERTKKLQTIFPDSICAYRLYFHERQYQLN